MKFAVNSGIQIMHAQNKHEIAATAAAQLLQLDYVGNSDSENLKHLQTNDKNMNTS